jgi:hypothetical protein
MDLAKALNNVNSKEAFLEFVQALAADRAEEEKLEKQTPSSAYGPGGKGWENGSISSYLEAMVHWVSAPANKKEFPEKVDWKTFAKILYAGKFYE